MQRTAGNRAVARALEPDGAPGASGVAAPAEGPQNPYRLTPGSDAKVVKEPPATSAGGDTKSPYTLTPVTSAAETAKDPPATSNAGDTTSPYTFTPVTSTAEIAKDPPATSGGGDAKNADNTSSPAGSGPWRHAAKQLAPLRLTDPEHLKEQQGSRVAYGLRRNMEAQIRHMQMLVRLLEASIPPAAAPIPKSRRHVPFARRSKVEPRVPDFAPPFDEFEQLLTDINFRSPAVDADGRDRLRTEATEAIALARAGNVKGLKDLRYAVIGEITFLQGHLIRGALREDETEAMRDYTVHYDTDEEMRATEVTFDGGAAQQRDKPFDTGGAYSKFSGVGWAIFVMTPNGAVRASVHRISRYHHSSLAAGKPVLCAGEIKVAAGRIVGATNKSGHYKPPARTFIALFLKLEEEGVDLDGITDLRLGGFGKTPDPDSPAQGETARSWLMRMETWHPELFGSAAPSQAGKQAPAGP